MGSLGQECLPHSLAFFYSPTGMIEL